MSVSDINKGASGVNPTMTGGLLLTGGTMTGPLILASDPTIGLEAATKNYVDAGLQGLSPKPAPAVATTTTLPAYTYNNGSSGVGATITMTATGVVAIDGRNLVLNDLVLVKNEIAGNAPYNGLFNVTIAGAVGVALVLTRNTSMDISAEFSGAYLVANGGTINAGSGWWCTNSSAPTIGTTAITFSQFNGASGITAGTGLTKVGNTLSIDSTVATLTGSEALTNKTVNGLTPTALATGFTLAGGTTSKTLTVPLDASVSGTNTGDQTTISGNAGTATALQTARTIGGVSFDGTANTTVSSATGGFTISGGDLAVGANNITGTGSLGATASRLTKGWFTDLQVTNAIAGSVTGSAATLTTTRAIYGNNFDGSAALTQVIASTYGGTGNGFAKLSGPATTEKTFTLPNASATILTDNAAVTVAQGGSGRASTTAYAVICGGTTSTSAEQSIASVGTAGQVLTSNGASALPSFQAISALSGSIIQIVNTQTGAVASGTTSIPYDDTIPQNTEGDQYMSLAITPTNASNKLKIDVVFNWATNTNAHFTAALFQDSTAGALAAVLDFTNSSFEAAKPCVFSYYMTAGTTSATTFKIRGGMEAGATTTFNGVSTARKLGGVMASSITITEIKV